MRKNFRWPSNTNSATDTFPSDLESGLRVDTRRICGCTCGVPNEREIPNGAEAEKVYCSSSSSIISLLFFALEAAGFAFFEGGLAAAVLEWGAHYAKMG